MNIDEEKSGDENQSGQKHNEKEEKEKELQKKFEDIIYDLTIFML